MLNEKELEEKLNASPSLMRLTKEYLESIVKEKSFHKLTDRLTVCVIKTVTGFELVGKSTCLDPANYSQEIGEKVSYEDAFNKLWELEGYILREKLNKGE